MAWLWYSLLLLIALTGLLLNILTLPGLWLMVAATAGYAWLTGWKHFIGPTSMTVLILLAIAGELLEFAATAGGTKAAGARKRGIIGAIVGALLGGIFLSFVPVPIVSTIVGACLGAFIGAAVMELSDRDFRHALRVGVGAAKGRFMGIVIKLAIGAMMFVIILIAALPI
ncbi:MAG TPA: DUF456 domain-containing protein [Tepidisphaeraceae bacterium]|nr:DUF456 domain-containing protein [Tepidisphaeraceae bacterium]